jgi:4'-phosphopantetheinyl transferase
VKPSAWPTSSNVDLWWLDPSRLSERQWAQLHEFLNDEELARTRAAKSLCGARELVAGRGLLRSVLGAYVGVEPVSLRIELAANGKPRLAEHEELHFNLSHTRKLVVCAVARRELGVDAEYVTRPAPLAVARHYFSERERAELSAHGAAASRQFFKYWTVKEAFLKARADGLAQLRGVECEFEGSQVRLRVQQAPVRASAWSVVTWAATPDHQLALVLEDGSERLSLRLRPHAFGSGLFCLPAASPTELTAFSSTLG